MHILSPPFYVIDQQVNTEYLHCRSDEKSYDRPFPCISIFTSYNVKNNESWDQCDEQYYRKDDQDKAHINLFPAKYPVLIRNASV